MVWAVPRHNISFSAAEYFKLIRGFFAGSHRGRLCRIFENKFAEYIGADQCFTFWSGSAALYHGIKAAGLGSGDKILFPAYEFTTVAGTLKLCGLELAFVEVDGGSGNVTVESLRDAHKNNPDAKAALVANIHGRCADLPAIAAFCKKEGILLIEDCAHSAGASIGGAKAGSFGDFSIFSFGHGKSLVACGGGAIITSNAEIGAALKEAGKNLKAPPRTAAAKGLFSGLAKGLLSTKPVFTIFLFPILYLLSFLGDENLLDDALANDNEPSLYLPVDYSYWLPDAYALMALSQLGRLNSLNEVRVQNAKELMALLFDEKDIILAPPFTESEHVYLNFRVEVPNGKSFAKSMLRSGVDIRRDYLLHYFPDNEKGAKPEHSVYLPNHPGLGKNQLEKIADAAKKAVSGG